MENSINNWASQNPVKQFKSGFQWRHLNEGVFAHNQSDMVIILVISHIDDEFDLSGFSSLNSPPQIMNDIPQHWYLELPA